MKRVRAKSVYVYAPIGLDKWDPKSSAVTGQTVRVVALRGCPPPNTMGHCHIETLDGKLLGLVLCASLMRANVTTEAR